MTKRAPTIHEHQLDTLRADAHKAIDALCARALTIQHQRTNWQRGYPAGGTEGGGGHGSVADTMAEQLATTMTASHYDQDGDWRKDENGDPVPPGRIRIIPDPGLTATVWCSELAQLFAKLWELEAIARDLVPPQPTPGRESTIGTCDCCGRDVMRTTEDPLRRGLCNACRLSWKRSPDDDFEHWKQQRRRMLGVELRAGA